VNHSPAARRLVATIRRDVALQARYRLYAVSVFVVVVLGGVLHLLPGAARADALLVVPAFVLFNVVVTTFYFVGALVLLERDEGTLTALVATPLRDAEYLLSKVITLTALAAVETLLVVLLLFGLGFDWPLLLAGTMLLGALFVLVGFVSVVRYASIDRWLMPSVPAVTALMLPALSHFGLVGEWLYYAHPAGPAFLLLRAASGAEVVATSVAFGRVGALAWVAVAFVWARRRYERHVVREAFA
jgi:fluoroquinolone transport system permease protein